MIIRTVKNQNYSVINNTVLRDDRLSWRARGIAAYLLTMPDDWEISHTHLWKRGTEGRDAVLNAMKELEELGYLVRIKVQGKGGKFSTEVALYEVPQPSPENQASVNQDSVNQKSVNQKSVDQVSVNQDSLISTNQLSTNQLSTKEEVLRECVAGATATPQQEMFAAICEAVGWDYNTLSKDDKGQVAQAVGILRKANYTVDDIRRFMVEVWFKDWRWEKERQHPTLKQLRQEIGKLRSVMKDVAPPPKSKGLESWRRLGESIGVTT